MRLTKVCECVVWKKLLYKFTVKPLLECHSVLFFNPFFSGNVLEVQSHDQCVINTWHDASVTYETYDS